MEIDSKPTEIDEVDRHIMQLEIELQSLGDDDDAGTVGPARAARAHARRGARALRRDARRVAAREGDSRRRGHAAGAARRGQDRARARSARGRSGPRRRAAVRDDPRADQAARRPPSRPRPRAMPPAAKFLKDVVDSEDVAEVVAKWTGIPVIAPDGGRDREARPHGGAAAPARRSARTRRSRPCPPRCGAHGPACRTPIVRSAPSCSSAPPASARPSWPGPWPSSCSTPRTRSCGSTCPSTWRSTRSRGSSARPPATSATRRAAS